MEELRKEGGVFIRSVEKTVPLKEEDGRVHHRQNNVRLTHRHCESCEHGAAEDEGELEATLAEEQEKNGDDGVEGRETIRVVQEEGTDDGGDGDHVDCPEERLHGFLDGRKGAAVRFQGSQFA